MKILSTSIVFILSATVTGAALAGKAASSTTSDKDQQAVIAHGEQAHSQHCVKCHTDQVYTRENRFVKSLDALSKQVQRCKNGNNIPWFDEDAEAVVQFLNQKYYKF